MRLCRPCKTSLVLVILGISFVVRSLIRLITSIFSVILTLIMLVMLITFVMLSFMYKLILFKKLEFSGLRVACLCTRSGAGRKGMPESSAPEAFSCRSRMGEPA